MRDPVKSTAPSRRLGPSPRGSTRAAILAAALVCWMLALADPILLARAAPAAPLAASVHSVGMTVSDVDRALGFYTTVLSFEKVSDVEVWGDECEHLQGVFGLRMRVVRLRLGEEFIELTEYLAPRGRSIPTASRSNDHWFQHIAIIVSDDVAAIGKWVAASSEMAVRARL